MVDPGAKPRRPRRGLVAAVFAFGVCLLALPAMLSDREELVRTLQSTDPRMLLLPLLLTVASYAAMSRSYQGIADIAGCRLSFRRWLQITYVSNAVNFVVPSAGLSGFAVRMYLLSHQGVARGQAVLISLVQTLLTNFTLLFFILGGFVSLVVHERLETPALITATVAVAAFAGILTLGGVLIFHRRWRRQVLLRVANLAHRGLHRFAPRRAPRRVKLWRFQHNLNEGLDFVLARKNRMIGPAAWIMLDWVLTIGILWAAFRAVRNPLPPGIVAVGFAVGVFLSLVSFVPGGLGVMDLSMTAVFASLGVPLEPAVLAVYIFRVAYYFLPLLTSVVLFWSALRQAAHDVATASETDAAI